MTDETITDDEYRAALRATHNEGMDVDDDAVVSRGDDDGAYVQCWVWVHDGDARPATNVYEETLETLNVYGEMKRER